MAQQPQPPRPPRPPTVWDAHRHARSRARRREVLDLYVAHPGQSYYAIGKIMGISAGRVRVLVQEALQQAAEDEKDLSAVALARSIKMHMAAMEAAWEIVQLPCGKCHGVGMQVARDDNGQPKQTLDNTGAIVDETEPCSLCDHSSGYAYPYQARLGAIDRHQRAVEQLNKLLGLYEPDRVNVLVNYRQDLQNLPEEELARMLREYAAGYTDALEDTGNTPAQEVA